jgi:hypothetical protein
MCRCEGRRAFGIAPVSEGDRNWNAAQRNNTKCKINVYIIPISATVSSIFQRSDKRILNYLKLLFKTEVIVFVSARLFHLS